MIAPPTFAREPFGSRSGVASTIARGLICGVAGATALSVGEVVERALLGRLPIYAATRIAERLASNRGVTLTPPRARLLGQILRWSYAGTLGIVRMAIGGVPGARLGRAVVWGSAIYGSELVMLPRVGATPPLARWTKAELALLAGHATVFALGAEWARSMLATTGARRETS